jgi:hypothetical protein
VIVSSNLSTSSFINSGGRYVPLASATTYARCYLFRIMPGMLRCLLDMIWNRSIKKECYAAPYDDYRNKPISLWRVEKIDPHKNSLLGQFMIESLC